MTPTRSPRGRSRALTAPPNRGPCIATRCTAVVFLVVVLLSSACGNGGGWSPVVVDASSGDTGGGPTRDAGETFVDAGDTVGTDAGDTAGVEAGDTGSSCPSGPDVDYQSRNADSDTCRKKIDCPAGRRSFFNTCGCGCAHWCTQFSPGASSSEEPVLQLSEAHGAIRFFTPAGDYGAVDEALVRGLRAASGTVDLSTYAAQLSSVCARDAKTDASLPQASSRMDDGVLWVQPGEGTPDVPREADRVVLDLRDLPTTKGTAEALRRTTEVLLQKPMAPLRRRRRTHAGLTDEVYSQRSLYRNRVERRRPEKWPGGAERSRSLVVATGWSMPAPAAELAITLRLRERAPIVGSSVSAAVAESKWASVGEEGLAWRAYELLGSDGTPVRDVVPADARARVLDEIAPDDEVWTVDPLEEAGEVKRQEVRRATPFGDRRDVRTDPATLRAALITIHAAADLFFPYFSAIDPDGFDGRLLETWSRAADGNVDRTEARNQLRYLGAGLRDGHAGVRDYGRQTAGLLPVYLDVIGGELVVRSSAIDEIRAGDVITRIDGREASSWLQEEYARSSGSTAAYREFRAAQQLAAMDGARTFELRAPDGTTRSVTIEPQPRRLWSEVVTAGSDRSHGWIQSSNGADVYYINLDGEYAGTTEQVRAALREARGAAGLVLDMRGHPAAGRSTSYNPYDVLKRVMPEAFASPAYDVPRRVSWREWSFETVPYERTFQPTDDPAFHGPVALLTAPWSISAAEDFAIMLEQADRATFVGRNTAGTTGSITGLQLPGGFAFVMTGMRARYRDGSQHFAKGTAPDVRVVPAPADFADGAEPVIDRAVQLLRSQ